ncbi:hypothetical protein B0A48_04318 [Cryoendolithus antarcticus]|uniref:Uncharacterized protein n=1 Tax=Cryoendolithus antarcticus TaxID=1507870 RepID=A0A1V8TF12_9PEZI|nr:hypothetical protein B0A48_04318 [Cryoendolithus antarcticus]
MPRHDSKSPQRLSGKTLPTLSEVTLAPNPPMRLVRVSTDSAQSQRDIQDITAGLNGVIVFLKYQHKRHVDSTLRDTNAPGNLRALYDEVTKTLNLQRDFYASLPGRSVEQDVDFGMMYLQAHKSIMEISEEVERAEEAREWWRGMDVGVRVERNGETGEPRVLFRVVRKCA